MLDELSRNGVIVVASAGNDATERPSYPAAFAPWKNGKGHVKPRREVLPIVSVGALNPNRTDALFTNGGEWVRCYAPGASVMSTMPPFQGGLQPVARTFVDGRVRESIDPDDYRGAVGRAHRGGFGLWSGTSFAAPTVAGALAAVMSTDLMKPERFGHGTRRGHARLEGGRGPHLDATPSSLMRSQWGRAQRQ